MTKDHRTVEGTTHGKRLRDYRVTFCGDAVAKVEMRGTIGWRTIYDSGSSRPMSILAAIAARAAIEQAVQEHNDCTYTGATFR
jgi:hypothetical protein